MTAAGISDYLGKELGYIHTRGAEVPTLAVKHAIVYTPDTADDGDTLSVDLNKYGMTKLWGIRGITHTTDNSVLVVEAPTTSVTGTTLTITVGGSTDNKTRSFLLIGE